MRYDVILSRIISIACKTLLVGMYKLVSTCLNNMDEHLRLQFIQLLEVTTTLTRVMYEQEAN